MHASITTLVYKHTFMPKITAIHMQYKLKIVFRYSTNARISPIKLYRESCVWYKKNIIIPCN